MVKAYEVSQTELQTMSEIVIEGVTFPTIIIKGTEYLILNEFTKKFNYRNISSAIYNSLDPEDYLSLKARTINYRGAYVATVTRLGLLQLICGSRKDEIVRFRRKILSNLSHYGFA